MAETLNDVDLLRNLEPTFESLLERHLDTTKEWFPHEYVPYGRGKDPVQGEQWSEEDADLGGAQIDDAVRSALLVNLLTEDNLPYYFRTVERMLGRDGAAGEWGRRWTAEEGRHSMAIYGYLMVTRAVDPHQLERMRMAQVSGGNTPEPETAHHGIAYLPLQELATRISHRSTGQMIGDPAGYEVMRRVAGDENLHQLFYRDLGKAAIDIDPNGMMIALEEEVRGFAMPGAGIPGFVEHAKRIASAGIYDLEIHHNQILKPIVIKQWDALNISVTGLAAAAQERLGAYLAKSERVANRFAERKEAKKTEPATS